MLTHEKIDPQTAYDTICYADERGEEVDPAVYAIWFNSQSQYAERERGDGSARRFDLEAEPVNAPEAVKATVDLVLVPALDVGRIATSDKLNWVA